MQESRRRLEKRLNDLKDTTRTSAELSEILQAFDQNLDDIFGALMQNRLRFNTLMRMFFAELVIEVDRPGMGWKKGTKKGEFPVYNPCLRKFAFEPRFADFVDLSGIDLPQMLKQAERQSPQYLSSLNGSPLLAVGLNPGGILYVILELA